MSPPDDGVRLTALSPAAGCAAKLGMDELDGLLADAFDVAPAGVVAPPSTGAGAEWAGGAPGGAAPGSLDELGIGDDAAVVALGPGDRVVATTDFFTPIVDDARTWGHVAATNAIGDVHAMGATPRAALVVLGWPAGQHRRALGNVLAGLRQGADADATALVGGHSIDAAVPFVGLAVLGDLDAPPLRQDAARPGDRLVLTAPLGTGIVATAARAASVAAVAPGGDLHDVYTAAVAVMTSSNGPVVGPARAHGVRAATDVTGFGLLGHLHRMAARSGVDVVVRAERVPLVPGVVALADDDAVSGGSRRNGEAVVARAGVDTDARTLAVLADAQTSGGLLVACPPGRTADLLASLDALGRPAAEIGEVARSGTGRIRVDGSVA